MSDQLDPIGAVSQHTQTSPSSTAGFEFVIAPQEPQVRPVEAGSSLIRILDALNEPALLHRDGRILGLNAGLAALLGHPVPDRLVGLPADAVLLSAGPSQPGSATQVVLNSHRGGVPVSLSTLDMELRDSSGTLWIFGHPHATDRDLANRAARNLEEFCDTLWARSTPGHTELLQNLTEVLDLLTPPEEEPVRISVDIADAVRVVVDPGAVDVLRTARVDASPEAVQHLLVAMTRNRARDARVRVDVDVSGRPVVVIRRPYGPAVPASSIQGARVLATGMQASLISLDGGRVVRLRLPAAPALPTLSQ